MNTSITRRHALRVFAALPVFRPFSGYAAEQPLKMVITKDPSCGCCSAWAEHIKAAGFQVEVIESEELDRVKVRLGVPGELASCHTAEVGGYVVEGHVPAAAVKRLLAERPSGLGLAVPGMPVGAPGMEIAGATPEAFEVVLFDRAGRRPFARFKGGEAL